MNKIGVSDINILNDLEKLISDDNVECVNFLDSFTNKTNLIILATKHNKVNIIKYLFNDEAHSFMEEFSPHEEDDTCHNAFYYAIRSGNVELLDHLINKWPGCYFDDHLDELEKVLSKSYEELKLKNVELQEEMKTFIENKLINLRFFSNTSVQDQSLIDNPNTIKERIDLVLHNICLLCAEYTNAEKVDENLLHIAQFIAKNIHILKWQLKSTYDKLPWEEMEFCLLSFIFSYTKHQEFNLFCHAILNKIKILNHLKNFGNALETIKGSLENVYKNKIAELPKLNRNKVVTQIINNLPQFEELYKDYEQIRDTYSLIKIDSMIKMVIFANPKDMNYPLVLTRALQVIGEYLKNSLESPKMSSNLSEILITTLPINTKKIIINLRNSLSHAHSLTKRKEIEENSDINFFIGAQNDIKKIGSMVSEILYKNKIKTILSLLKLISNTDNLDEIKRICDIFRNIKIDVSIPENSKLMEQAKVENFIKELSDCIKDKTDYEIKLFDQINSIIEYSENKLDIIKTDYAAILHTLRNTVFLIINLNIDNVKEIKYIINEVYLKSFSTNVKHQNLKQIAKLSTEIFVSLKARLEGKCLENEMKLILDILYIVEFGIADIKYIEDLRNKICEKRLFTHLCKKDNILCSKKEKYSDQLLLKLSKLEDILTRNSLTNKLVESIPFYKNNKNLQIVIEMLVLDIMSLLSISNDYLENNLLFLDEHSPLLTGKCLRNHLAHDNAICDLLLDPTVAVILNANILIKEQITKSEKKIGKFVRDDPSKLKDKLHQDLITVTNQSKMFLALEKGNLDKVKYYLKKGADLNGRSLNMWNAIHFAAKGPDLSVIQFLLNQNLDINAEDIDGQNALHIAAAYGRANIVQFLVNEGDLTVNDIDNEAKTPLHIAARNGQKEAVEILLKNNSKIHAKDKLGFSPVHYAVQNNYIDIAKALLINEEDVDIYQFGNGLTLLNIAASRGHIDLINLLLERKASVNTRNLMRLTPLHNAALNGHLEAVKALILKGANVNFGDVGGCTPLHYSVENGHVDITETLLKYGANPNIIDYTYNNTPLHYASKDGDLKIVEILLKNEANVSLATVEGITPLHFAAMSGHLEIVIALLKNVVNIQAKTMNGDSPLHCAVRNGHKEVAEFLIKNKAEVNAKNHIAFSVLHIAALEGHTYFIDFLLRNSAEVGAQDIQGRTPLHAASMNGNKDVIGILINNKAEVNAKENDGLTPLHICAIRGHADAVSVLIENGAEINAENKYGFIPLQFAIVFGHKYIVKLLIEHNSQASSKSLSYSTLYCLAVEAGNTEIIEVLISYDNNFKNENPSPLISAIHFNKKEIVEVLIANGCSVNTGNPPPIIPAILKGRRDIVEILIKNNANINFEESTPLYLAAKIGDSKIVAALLRGGAELNTLNMNNIPLHIAAIAGHKDVIEVLIAKGANVNIICKEGYTALHWAAWHGYVDVIKILLHNGINFTAKDNENRTSLELAVSYGQIESVKILLKYQKGLDLKGNDDWTLLHIASQEANLKMVQYLVAEGADINARNKSGSKPIHIAAREGHTETVKFFLDNGSNINDHGVGNQTLLHYAAIRGNLEVIEYLVEKGINVNVINDNGETPLHIGVLSDNKEAVNVLLKNGAVFNKVGNIGRKYLVDADDTINLLSLTDKLFKAVKCNNLLEIENCIKEGAAVNAKAGDNGTPLHYAAWKGHEEVVNLLLQKLANPNAIGKNGVTPLHYAAKFSHIQITKSLLSYGAVYNAISDTGKTPTDLAVDIYIKNIFKIIDDSFKNIKICNSNIIYDIKKITDVELVKAIMCACDRDHKTLVVAAMLNNFSKVEELKEVAQGNISEDIINALQLISEDKYEIGLKIFKSVFEKRKEILGSDNPGTLDIQSHIASVLFKQGVYQEALTMLEEILHKQKRILGLNYKDTLETRSTIALVLHSQGKNEEASSIYQDVYQKQKQILGPNHSDTLVTQLHLALVLDAQGKYEEALNINREVYEKRKITLGSNHQFTITAQNNVALVLSRLGKFEEAIEIYKLVYEKKKVIFGIYHSDTLRTLHNISTIFHQQKKYEEAMEYLEEVLNVQVKYLGWNNPDTMNTQYSIACTLLSQGKCIAALKKFQENLNQRMAVLETNHPTILCLLDNIKQINLKYKFIGKNVSEVLQILRNDMNIAASSGDVRTVLRLLKYGIDVNDIDSDGRTPIFFAVDNGQIGIVNILLKSGARVTQTTTKGNTTLHIATSKGNKEIIEVLLQVVSHDRLDNFVNAKTTSGGTTALHVAAKSGFLEIVKYLLTHGAVYNIEDNNSMKPINLSTLQRVTNFLMLVEELFQDAKKGNDKIMNKLQKLMPDEFLAVTYTVNIHGNTLLQITIANRHTNITYKLIEMLKKIEPKGIKQYLS